MSLYKYDAKDIAGNPRSGEISADSEELARRLLSQRSFTDIQLEELEPPPPPTPLSKKLLIALSVLLALVVTGYFIADSLLAPPEMEAIYAEWDAAVKANDFDTQFKNFQKTFISESGGRFDKLDRDKLKRQLKERVEKEELVRTRTTKIEAVKRNGAFCLVPVTISEFTGKAGTLNSKIQKFRKIHVWKREGLTWQIYLVKDLPKPPEQ